MQSYIVRFLKERIRGEKEREKGDGAGGRGRGRGRGRGKKGGASVGGTSRGTPTLIVNGDNASTPGQNGAVPPTLQAQGSGMGSGTQFVNSTAVSAGSMLPVSTSGDLAPDSTTTGSVPIQAIPTPTLPPPPASQPKGNASSPIIIVEDVDVDIDVDVVDEEGPALKKRRLDDHGGAIAV